MLIPSAQFDDHFRSFIDHVFESRRVFGCAIWGAEAQDMGEQGLGVFAAFEGEEVDTAGEGVEEVFLNHRCDELDYLVRIAFSLYC